MHSLILVILSIQHYYVSVRCTDPVLKPFFVTVPRIVVILTEMEYFT